HISDVDFSLHGGAVLYINNSNNTVITDCNFQAPTSNDLIYLAPSSSGVTVKYCDLTGGTTGSGLIGAGGGGNIVVQYNLMQDFPQHAVEIGGNATLDYRYNLIENGGTVTGQHLNFLQFTGTGVTDSTLVEFNTTYQTPQPAGAGEAFQFYIWDPTG